MAGGHLFSIGVQTRYHSSSTLPTYQLMYVNSALQGLTTKQIAFLSALAREPTAKVYLTSYMAQYNLGSTGGIQQGLDSLSKKDLIEKNHKTGAWAVVDPFFKNWLIVISL
jgi:choline dehydrogenase-like flavoprotein